MGNIAGIRYDYKIHPLAKLFPEMPPGEFKKLKADIVAHRQQEPIMLSPDGEVLLDGRNRLRACKELGIQPRVERLDRSFISEGDFIWSANFLRRHLTDDQRATCVRRWADAEREAAKERQKQHGGTAPGKPKKNTSGESAHSVRTRQALAQKAQISEHKVRQVETVAKHAPELLPKLESGEMKLIDAVKTIGQSAVPSHEESREEKERRQRQETENKNEDQDLKLRCSDEIHYTFDFIVRTWPKNCDLAPAIKALRTTADNLEALQNKRTAEFKNKVQSILVGAR